MIMSNSKYIDRFTSRLNACSLEVLQTHQQQTSIPHNQNDKAQDTTVDTHGMTSKSVSALVVGCYQLNETTKTTSTSSNPDDDDNENDINSSENATRSGELQLYMIQSEESSVDLKFGEPVHVFDQTSGILDGKWYQRRPLSYSTNSAASVSGTDIDTTTNRDNDNQQDRPVEEEEDHAPSGGNTHRESEFVYATACASGNVEVYALRREGDKNSNQQCEPRGVGGFRLQPIGSSSSPSADDDDDNDAIGATDHGLCLSLAWDESAHPIDTNDCSTSSSNTQTRIVSSYSGGTLAIHDVSLTTSDKINLTETHRIHDAHSLFGCPSEVWTVCFASNTHYSTYTNTIISGGDDCKMKLWDLRQTSSSSSSSRPTHVVGSNEFEAGVTAVSYHPFLEHVFASGSYDEGLRIWDMRMLVGGGGDGSHRGGCDPIAKVDSVGGGVWRIKWHPKDGSRVLVGAMHGGCRVITVPGLCQGDGTAGGGCEEGNSGLESPLSMVASSPQTMAGVTTSVVKEFTEHESMAYGADWLYCKSEAAASCSFYDRQVFMWDSL